MFIALRVAMSYAVLDLLKSKDNIRLFAEIAISVLLFTAGLKQDLSIIKSTDKTALLSGLGQVLFASFFGYLYFFSTWILITPQFLSCNNAYIFKYHHHCKII